MVVGFYEIRKFLLKLLRVRNTRNFKYFTNFRWKFSIHVLIVSTILHFQHIFVNLEKLGILGDPFQQHFHVLFSLIHFVQFHTAFIHLFLPDFLVKDLIFVLFEFIVGCLMPASISKSGGSIQEIMWNLYRLHIDS